MRVLQPPGRSKRRRRAPSLCWFTDEEDPIAPNGLAGQEFVMRSCSFAMPISYEFRDEILVVRIMGDYESADFTRTIAQGYTDPRFLRTTPILIDARESESSITGDEMQRIKRRIIGQLPAGHEGKWAMVTRTDPLRYGIGRMAGLVMESMGVPAVIFTDIEEARIFLRSGGQPSMPQ